MGRLTGISQTTRNCFYSVAFRCTEHVYFDLESTQQDFVLADQNNATILVECGENTIGYFSASCKIKTFAAEYNSPSPSRGEGLANMHFMRKS